MVLVLKYLFPVLDQTLGLLYGQSNPTVCGSLYTPPPASMEAAGEAEPASKFVPEGPTWPMRVLLQEPEDFLSEYQKIVTSFLGPPRKDLKNALVLHYVCLWHRNAFQCQ